MCLCPVRIILLSCQIMLIFVAHLSPVPPYINLLFYSSFFFTMKDYCMCFECVTLNV